MKPRVGIESPLAGNIPRNQRYARWCMYDSLMRGEAPFVSHLLYTQVLNDRLERHREIGISAGEPFYDACAYRAFYNDLDDGKFSSGMTRALRRAKNRWGAFFHLLGSALKILFTSTRWEVRQLPTDMFYAFEKGQEPLLPPLQQYLHLLSSLLKLRANKGELPESTEFNYAEVLSDLWHQLSPKEQESIETLLKSQ